MKNKAGLAHRANCAVARVGIICPRTAEAAILPAFFHSSPAGRALDSRRISLTIFRLCQIPASSRNFRMPQGQTRKPGGANEAANAPPNRDNAARPGLPNTPCAFSHPFRLGGYPSAINQSWGKDSSSDAARGQNAHVKTSFSAYAHGPDPARRFRIGESWPGWP